MLRLVTMQFDWADQISFSDVALVDEDGLKWLEEDVWPVEIYVGSNQNTFIERGDIDVEDLPSDIEESALLTFLNDHRINGRYIWQVLEIIGDTVRQREREAERLKNGHFENDFADVFPPEGLDYDKAAELLGKIIALEKRASDPRTAQSEFYRSCWDRDFVTSRQLLESLVEKWYVMLARTELANMAGFNRESVDRMHSEAADILCVPEDHRYDDLLLRG